MKEHQMVQPNSLGHYHRNIAAAVVDDRYYMRLTLSCGHETRMSKQGYQKYAEHAVLCMQCSTGANMEARNIEMLDITAPETPVQVEIQERANGYVLYVHVEGMTVLRICQIKEQPVINDGEA